MPLQATSGAASYDAFGGGVAAVPNYIEDVFSTWLYTGNGSTQTINNGIDLAGKGGLVWLKQRGNAAAHYLFDTARGNDFTLNTNNTSAQGSGWSAEFTSFNSTGFSLASPFGTLNGNGNTYVSWTFREQRKFFDVVTFTSSASGNKTFSHNLGAVPGCVIIKNTQTADPWLVYHRSVGDNAYLSLNSTAAQDPLTGAFSATSTTFTISSSLMYNSQTYVAYLFAHNAGGFGLTGTDNVISCGSFTTSSIGLATVDLGYEPQWILYKGSNGVTNWQLVDNMRGFVVGAANSGTSFLNANTSAAEGTNPPVGITNTGFNFDGPANISYIYIAIRRGPMRTPTSSTGLYSANRYQYNSGYAGGLTTTTVSGAAGGFGGFPTDLVINTIRNQSGDVNRQIFLDRLRGIPGLWSTQTYAESSPGAPGSDAKWDNMVGVTTSGYPYYVFTPYIFTNFFFRRAPGFFDVVCDTGTGSARTVAHNLTVVPELMIRKMRGGVAGWYCYHSALGNTDAIRINSTSATASDVGYWNNTTPTSTQFTVGTSGDTNQNTATFVTYLFASCPGVSKVGSYTGTGGTQTINCGFTGGARFVMIKRTDSTGNWWVWDTVDGMVTGTNPRIPMNTTTAEANNDWVFTTAGGFQIVTTDATVNASGGTYIFLAIA